MSVSDHDRNLDQRSQTNRIPTLDGWRGIAIALVLYDHFHRALIRHPTGSWIETGQHGVTIFFVLSGFLITSKLLGAEADLKRFYLRRFFRLMPVAWAYLAALLLLGSFTHLTFAPPAAVLACLFFYRNFLSIVSGAATWHFWSLSMEEQFYLIWPCILLFAGPRRSRWIALSGAIGFALYRFCFWSDYNQGIFNCQTQVRSDALLVGCLMALLQREPTYQALVSKWSKVVAIPALFVLVYCIVRFPLLPPLTESIGVAALMAASMHHSESVFAWPLKSRVLTQLGLVSYSLYVWQGLFMVAAPSNQMISFLFLFVAMPLCALASYELIEQPFTRLGRRLTLRGGGQSSPAYCRSTGEVL